MTVYNGLPYLERALQSIRKQTFEDYEFVIVDDGSSDGSVELVQSYAARDGRIRLLANTKNKGQTPCLNQGLAEARGEWIARQDADDLSDAERLAAQMECVSRRPELGLLGTNGWLVDAEGRSLGLINAPTGEACVRWSSVFYNPFLHTSVLFKRELALSLGGYDASYRIAQDYDLWTRIMKSHPADNLSERLVTYRVHKESLSNSDRETTAREAYSSCLMALEALGLQAFSDPESLKLISEFREGISPTANRKFWELHFRMRYARGAQDDLARAVALMHWKAAGALARKSPLMAFGETLQALASAPFLVSRLLRERRMARIWG
jgi:glycosyltransferase involved in cell wall biosynthesis